MLLKLNNFHYVLLEILYERLWVLSWLLLSISSVISSLAVSETSPSPEDLSLLLFFTGGHVWRIFNILWLCHSSQQLLRRPGCTCKHKWTEHNEQEMFERCPLQPFPLAFFRQSVQYLDCALCGKCPSTDILSLIPSFELKKESRFFSD